jgi:hypothetical protein
MKLLLNWEWPVQRAAYDDLQCRKGSGLLYTITFLDESFYVCGLVGFPAGRPGPGVMVRSLFYFFRFRPYLFGNPSSRSYVGEK